MKSSELRQHLLALEMHHGDRVVYTEGCDCVGDAGSVTFEYGEFYIRREGEQDVVAEQQRIREQVLHLQEKDAELSRRYPGLLPD